MKKSTLLKDSLVVIGIMFLIILYYSLLGFIHLYVFKESDFAATLWLTILKVCVYLLLVVYGVSLLNKLVSKYDASKADRLIRIAMFIILFSTVIVLVILGSL